jgi:hypothetical protein
MTESELPGVQHLARPKGTFSVERIADHRMADVMEMDTDLMSATTVNRALEQAQSAA